MLSHCLHCINLFNARLLRVIVASISVHYSHHTILPFNLFSIRIPEAAAEALNDCTAIGVAAETRDLTSTQRTIKM